jgi:uncharacterized protein
MKKIPNFIVFAIFLAISLTTKAQIPTENSMLWEISGNGLSKTSYLYGTIHVICPENLKIDSSASLAFKNTDQLYLELDMDDPEMTEKMQKTMIGKIHLRYLLDEQNYEKLADFFKDRIGYSIDMLGMIKPFYLLSFTYSPMIGCSQPVSVESSFLKMAKEQNKSVFGLETLEDQAKVFDNIPQKDQAAMLYEYVRDFDKMQENFQEMLRQYRNQDLVGLMNSASISNLKNEKFANSLVDKRNEHWAKGIPEIATKKATFFAFGAAHLGGENGVINLLRKAGYKVRAVTNN